MSADGAVAQIKAVVEREEPAYFAGVGSRETPEKVGLVMAAIAMKLTDAGWKLRSGAADGADLAFESGVRAGDSAKQIFLPYKGFNGSASERTLILPKAIEIAKEVHQAWGACSDFARKAHARNAHQVLGPDLNDPVAMVVCWTKDGAVDAATVRNAGGTRTAIVIAAERGIPVFNLQKQDIFHAFKRWVGDDLLAEAAKVLKMKGAPKAPPRIPPRKDPDGEPRPLGFRRR